MATPPPDDKGLWLPLYVSLLRHRRLKRLAQALHVPLPYALGLLSALWLNAMEQAQDGDLSAWADDDVADAAGWDGDAGAFVLALGEHGWLVDGHLANWAEYGGRLFAKRQADRTRQANHRAHAAQSTSHGSHGDVTVTKPDVTVTSHGSHGDVGGSHTLDKSKSHTVGIPPSTVTPKGVKKTNGQAAHVPTPAPTHAHTYAGQPDDYGHGPLLKYPPKPKSTTKAQPAEDSLAGFDVLSASA